MVDFNRILQKLQPVKDPDNYVKDNYGQNDIAKEVSDASIDLTPEGVHKILNSESTGGKNLQNPESSAKGNFQLIDSTRNAAINDLKKQGITQFPANPDRLDALLMKNQVDKYENALLNSASGPKEPSLENIDLMHKYGIQGGLDALNNPNTPESKAKFKDIKTRLNKQPLPIDQTVKPAGNLLDLLKDD
jgi:hypothetical protein